MKRLKDKVALITGAMRGIGLGIATKFIEEGAKVMLLDVDENELVNSCEKLPADQVSWLKADVTKSGELKAAVDKLLEKWGKLDIACCNAGIGGEAHLLWDYPEEAFDQVIDVNLKGVWLTMKHCMPAIAKSGGGSVLLISSVAGLRGAGKSIAYSASKHAVTGMMRTAAIEGAKLNIRVNSIHPGPVETEMVRGLEKAVRPQNPEEGKKILEKSILLRRYASTDDVANMALFLASDEANYITGCTHRVDGGFMTA